MKNRIFLIATVVTVILIFSFQTVFAGSWTYHYSAAKVQGIALELLEKRFQSYQAHNG